jgi:hypothetical protein
MGLFDYVFTSGEKRLSTETASLEERARRATAALVSGKESRDRIDELEARVGELALLCRALVTALEEKGALSHARLREVMDKIDAEDGVIDGQVTSARGQKKAEAKKAIEAKRAAARRQKADAEAAGDGEWRPPSKEGDAAK